MNGSLKCLIERNEKSDIQALWKHSKKLYSSFHPLKASLHILFMFSQCEWFWSIKLIYFSFTHFWSGEFLISFSYERIWNIWRNVGKQRYSIAGHTNILAFCKLCLEYQNITSMLWVCSHWNICLTIFKHDEQASKHFVCPALNVRFYVFYCSKLLLMTSEQMHAEN